MSGLGRYRQLLGRPHARALLGWSMVGRLPLGMTAIALILLLRGEGVSYGAAGIVVASYALCVGVGAPIAGRRVDRRGPTPVLRVRAVAYAGLLAIVVVLAVTGQDLVAIAIAAGLAGLALPPLSSTVRIVWPRLAPGELRSTAYALEAALQEVFFVGGPLLAALLAASTAWAALAGAAIASLTGASVVAALEPVRATPPSRSGGAGLLGALGAPGVRTVVLFATTLGLGFGPVELGVIAFADSEGARELGGIALACFSGGSLVGGLIAGMRPSRNDARRLLFGAVAIGLAMVGLQAAVSIPTLCALTFVAGLPIAPTVAAIYTLIDRIAIPGTVAEAFAWFGTAVSLGVATGMALAGVLIDERGTRWAFGVGAMLVLLGSALLWARRATLFSA